MSTPTSSVSIFKAQLKLEQVGFGHKRMQTDWNEAKKISGAELWGLARTACRIPKATLYMILTHPLLCIGLSDYNYRKELEMNYYRISMEEFNKFRDHCDGQV